MKSTGPSTTTEETKEALLERLNDPALTDREIESITKKLEVLKQHG